LTTIAFKDGILSSDSRMTCQDLITNEKCVKIHKVTNGYVAIAGSLADGLCLVEMMNGLSEYEDLSELQVSVLYVEIKNNKCIPYKLEFSGNNKIIRLKMDKICAIGSGSYFALGAMHSGASAIESIKVAAKLDVFTNARVQHVVCI
jgi:ATP-dependent protease HslVU (ClpYQ) peptidase subunit